MAPVEGGLSAESLAETGCLSVASLAETGKKVSAVESKGKSVMKVSDVAVALNFNVGLEFTTFCL